MRRVGLRVFCGFADAKFRSAQHSKNLMETFSARESPGQSIGADRGFRACPRLLEHGRRLLRKLKADLGCSEKKLSTSPRRTLTKSLAARFDVKALGYWARATHFEWHQSSTQALPSKWLPHGPCSRLQGNRPRLLLLQIWHTTAVVGASR